MKSLKIAALGVAAFGLAALPVAGVFAEAGTPTIKHQDQLEITVNPVCTLGAMNADGTYVSESDNTTHENGTNTNPQINTTGYGNATVAGGVWNDGTFNGTAGYRTDTLAITMQPGTKYENIGTTTMTVLCNNFDGYTISAVGTALTNASGTSGKNTIGVGDGADWDAATSASFWSFFAADASTEGSEITVDEDYEDAAAAPDTSTEIAKREAASDLNGSSKIKITYGAGINNAQESGTYTGTMTYTLAQLDSGNSAKSAKSNPEPKSPIKEQIVEEPKEETEKGIIDEDKETTEVEKEQDQSQEEKSLQQNSEDLGELTNEIQNLEEQVSSLGDRLTSMSAGNPNVIQNYYGTSTPAPVESTSGETIAEKPVQEGNTTGNITTNSTDTNSTKGTALGALSKSGGSSTAKEVESSDNTGMIVALVAVGAAAAAATGAYLYTKNQED